MKGYLSKLASYLPALIVQHLVNEYQKRKTGPTPVPQKNRIRTAVLFADVSGFTALSEAMAMKYGPTGCQHVAQKLNQYFEKMLRHISKQGGDIFKFAGDAVLVCWPESQDLVSVVRRAIQCALNLQAELHNADMGEGVHLSVKIGIGVGDISVLLFGGHQNRKEYVAVGAPLLQAFASEGKASAGQTVVSDKAWAMVSKYFPEHKVFNDGYAVLERNCKYQHAAASKKPLLVIQKAFDEAAREMGNEKLQKSLCSFIPYAIVSTLKQEMIHPDLQLEKWSSELRKVTILFVNLGLEEADLLAAAEYNDAVQRFQDVLVSVQECLYKYEGSLNKFLMDDKGSTLIAIWGLAPLQHDDDAVRGVLAALAICESLAKMRLAASVGVTTGSVFCGKVGNRVRREYSVLGDVVNTSARLMGYAHKKNGGGVLVDHETYTECKDRLLFDPMEPIKLKGKVGKTMVYRPYPPYIDLERMTSKRHELMLKIYSEQKLLRTVSTQGRLLRSDSMMNSFSIDGDQNTLHETHAKEMLKLLHGDKGLTPQRRKSKIPTKESGNDLTKLETLYILSPLLRTTTTSGSITTQGVITQSSEDSTISPSTSPFGNDTAKPRPHRASISTQAELDEMGILKRRSNFRRETLHSSTRASSNDQLREVLAASVDFSKQSKRRSSDFSTIASKGLIDCTMSRSAAFNSRRSMSLGMVLAASIKAVGVRYASRKTVESSRPNQPDPSQCVEIPGRIAWQGLKGTRDLLTKVLAMCGAANLIVPPRGRKNSAESSSGSMDSHRGSTNVITHLDLEISLPIAANVYKTELFVPSFDMSLESLSTMIARALDMCVEDCVHTIVDGVLWLLAVEPEVAHEIQGRHMFVQQQLLESEIRLQNGEGSVVVVEGQIGSGKTALLSSVATPSIPLVWSSNSLPYVLIAAADPYEWHSFGVWRVILKQYMKHILHSSRSVIVRNEDITYEEFVSFFEHLPALQPFLSLVSQLVDIYMEPTPLVAQLSAEERDAVTRGLVLALLRSLSSRENKNALRPSIILIDNAQYMHNTSWKLLTDIANAGADIGHGRRLPSALRAYLHNEMGQSMLPIMVVTTVRPFSFYTDTINSCRPAQFEALLRQDTVLFLKLGHLGRGVVAKMLNTIANDVTEMLAMEFGTTKQLVRADRDMIDKIWNFSGGNPLLLQHLASTIAKNLIDSARRRLSSKDDHHHHHHNEDSKISEKDRSMIVMRRNESGQRLVSFRDEFDVETDLTFPAKLHSVFGMQLDRLSIIHQMIAKVASVIGPTFSFDELCGWWPKDGNEEMLAREINRMEDLDIFQCYLPNQSKMRYKFNSPMLRHAVLERMLLQHRKELLQKGQIWNSAQDAKHREFVFKKDITLPALSSTCVIEKHDGGGVFSKFMSARWKTRCIQLNQDGQELLVRRNRGGEIVQRALLQSAEIAQLSAKSLHSTPDKFKFGFHLTVDKWIKKGVLEHESRTFRVAFASQQECAEWIQWIQFCIERIAFRHRDKFNQRSSADLTNENESIRVTAQITPRGASVKDVVKLKKNLLSKPSLTDSVLFVVIRQGLGLQLHSCSTGREPTNPYVVLFLQGTSKRTTIAINSGSTVANWNEGFMFEMSPTESTSGNVRFEVWNKDCYGSDDFMGYVDVSLASILGESTSSSSSAKTQQDKDKRISRSLEAKADNGCTVMEVKEWLELKPRYASQIVTGQLCVELHLILTPDAQKRREKVLNDRMAKSMKAASLKNVAVDNYQWQRVISSESSGSPKNRDRRNSREDEDRMMHSERRSTTSPVPFKHQSQLKESIQTFASWITSEMSAGRCPQVAEMEKRLATIKNEHLGKTAGHQSVKHLMTEAELLDSNSQEWIKSYGFLKEVSSPTISSASSGYEPLKSGMSHRTLDELNTMDRSSSKVFGVNTPRSFTGNHKLPKEYFYKDTAGKVRGPIKLSALRSLGTTSSEIMVRSDEGGSDAPWRNIAVVLAEVVVEQRIQQVQQTMMSAKSPSQNLESWHFNILRLNTQSLMSLITYDFSTLGVLVAFEVPLIKFVKFVRRVSELMTINNLPYHNFHHACDVCHTVFSYLYCWGGAEYFTHLEIFALLVAAFCHDLRHPGKNNGFQIATRSDVAMRFNDQSVLENMHAALTYELFREQGGLANIFSSIESSREKWSRAREVVCTTILATDMSCHFKLQTEFEKAIEHTKSISATAAQHAAQNKAFILKSKIRITLLKVMVHSADISNPTKDWEVSKEWSERVSKEFFAQGDAERKLGLPVSANMDRDTTNKAKLSLGFIDFIVAPLFTNVVKLLPAGSVAIESMASNREKYSKLYQASLAKNEKDMPDEEKEGMKRRQTMFNNFKRRASMVLRGNEGDEDEEEEDNDVSKPPGL